MSCTFSLQIDKMAGVQLADLTTVKSYLNAVSGKYVIPFLPLRFSVSSNIPLISPTSLGSRF